MSLEDLLVPAGSRLIRDPMDVRFSALPVDERAALVGVPWDWSMTGRPGARWAPEAIRRALRGLAVHSPTLGDLRGRPVDLGDLRVAPGDYEATMGRLERLSSALRRRYGFVLYLGGDHSITEHIVAGLAGDGARVGLLVLDAHYDMRSVEEGLTSGMWLWRLHERLGDRLAAAVVGIGEYANPPYLARRAGEAGVLVVPAVEVLRDPLAALEAVEWLEDQAADVYYVSVDMDHLDQAYAPGVNSPSPLGLTPHHTLTVIEEAFEALSPAATDIVEVVPALDEQGRTVRLAALIAARMIHLALQG